MYGNLKSYRIRTIGSNRKILQRKTKLIRKWFLYSTFRNQNFLAKCYRFIYHSLLFVLFFVCKENRSRLNRNFNAQMFCLRHNQPQPANLLFKISVPSARLSLGHFRVLETLTFKMRPSAQPFSWKWVLFAWEWKSFPYQTLNTNLVLIQRARGNSGMANYNRW